MQYSIVVMSCDKYECCWYPFFKCLDKYFPNHPKTYLITEGKTSKYSETIATTGSWTKRLKDALEQIKEDYILLMLEDFFIRKPVDEERINKIQFTDDITDISEWEYADTRNLTGIDFDLENLTDIEPLSKWDTSKFTYLRFTWGGDDLEPLSKWDVSNVVSLNLRCKTETLKPLKNWDVSSVEDLHDFFNGFYYVKTLEGVENWDVSSVTNMNRLCASCVQLEDISALSNWDVSSVTDLSSAFLDCDKLTSLHGLENWNVSSVENMRETFESIHFLSDISALSNWDVSNVKDMVGLFNGVNALLDLNDISGWDVSNVKAVYPTVSGLYNAFATQPFYHSNQLGKDLYEYNNKYYDYDHHSYVISDPSTLVKYTKDASAVANWDVQDIPAYAFNAEWSNIPSWN